MSGARRPRLRRWRASRRRPAHDAVREELEGLHRRIGWQPGHFYSPYPDLREVERRRTVIYAEADPVIPGVDLRAEAQLARLAELAPAIAGAPYGAGGGAVRFRLENPNLSPVDAALLHGQIVDLAPRRVIEVGSGHSSCAILDALERSGGGELTLVEPDADLVRSLLPPGDGERIELLERPVQDVEPERFARLAAGDVLFIDSSHVAKPGSDVSHLVFSVLPALAPGVRVHVHDVYHPFEYPLEWVAQGRAWNEAPLMRAFLQFNEAFRVELFGSWLARFHPGALAAAMPGWAVGVSSSLWLVRS